MPLPPSELLPETLTVGAERDVERVAALTFTVGPFVPSNYPVGDCTSTAPIL